MCHHSVIFNVYIFCSNFLQISVGLLPTVNTQSVVLSNGVYSMCSTATPYCYLTPSMASGQALAVTGQNWARQWCSNHSSALVIIDDPRVQNDVTEFINSVVDMDKQYCYSTGTTPSYTWYTAGQAQGTDAVVNVQSSWYNLNSTASVSLTISQANGNMSLDLSYVYVGSTISGSSSHTSITYAADMATYRRGYICQFSGTSSLCSRSSGLSPAPVIINNALYCFIIYYNGGMDWYSARSQCLLLGGDLAAVNAARSQQNNTTTLGLMLSNDNGYWIGLRNSWWSWTNNAGSVVADVTYTYWLQGPPTIDSNRGYVSLTSTSICVSWNGPWLRCPVYNGSTYGFICQSRTGISTLQQGLLSTTSLFSAIISYNSSYSTSTTSSPTPVISSYTTGYPSSFSSSWSSLSSSSSSVTTSASDSKLNLALYIGIGVGLGGGILVIIIVIIIVVVVVPKRRHTDTEKQKSDGDGTTKESEHVYINAEVLTSSRPLTIYPHNHATHPSSYTPHPDLDVTVYAVVVRPQRNHGHEMAEVEDEYSSNSNQPDVIYSDMSYAKQYPAKTTSLSSSTEVVKPAGINVNTGHGLGEDYEEDAMTVAYTEVNKLK